MGSGVDGILHITDSDGNPNVFNVNRDEKGAWLNTDNGHPENSWNPDNRFVFVRPRKSLHFPPSFWEGVVFDVEMDASL